MSTKKSSVLILVIFWFTWFWLGGTRNIISPLLPNIGKQLSLNILALSAIVTLGPLGQSVSSLCSGTLIRYLGRKNMIVLGLIIVCSTQFAATLMDTYLPIAALFFLSSIGFGMYLPSAISLLSSATPKDKRGKYIGLHETAFTTSSSIVSIFVSLTISLGLGWREIMRIWLIPSLLLLAAQIALISEHEPPETGDEKTNYKTEKRDGSWPQLRFFIFLASVACRNVGIPSILLLPVYLTSQLGADEPTAAFVVGAAAFIAILGQAASGYLSDVIGRFRLMLILNIVLPISLVGLNTLPLNLLLLIFIVILVFATHSFMPVMLAFISDISPLPERGKNIGIAMAVIGISATVHTSLIGYLTQFYGFYMAAVYSVIISLAGFLILLIAKPETRD